MSIRQKLKSLVKRQIKKVIKFTRPPGKSQHQGEAPHKLADVVEHYEKFTPIYHEVYGEVFQAGRPHIIEELLAHEMNSMNLIDGQRLLDAGCGVGGPSIWFAKQRNVTIDAITISPTQLGLAREAVAQAGLTDRIKVQIGDFHKLEEQFPVNTFDGVFFLESICHAESYRRVLASARKVLKPGGFVYIKDYSERDFRDEPAKNARAKEFLRKVYGEYCFTMMQRGEMLGLLGDLGYRVELVDLIPFVAEREDLSKQLGFEEKAGFKWREGLDFWLPELIEVRARKP
jgi:ubiquinone/menaquinone biosynthesis C-methylase UbiE